MSKRRFITNGAVFVMTFLMMFQAPADAAQKMMSENEMAMKKEMMMKREMKVKKQWMQRNEREMEKKSMMMQDYSIGQKFQRGLLNIITSPAEIPRAIKYRTEMGGPLYGYTIGAHYGLGWALHRASAGVIDLLTFPFGLPSGNRAPLIYPEYVWQ
jgi:putative exosortase-associated protein (TIGR04073 family)